VADFALTLDVIQAPTYIVYGHVGMTGVNLAQVAAGNGGYMLASAATRSNKFVDAIGDFNGDGLDDFVYYASRDTGFTSDAYLIYGSRNNPGLTAKSYLTDADLRNGELGFVISTGKGMFDRDAVSAGDINGDGLTDVVIRSGDAASLVVMGSTSSGKFGQVDADLVGGAGNDTLTSTGSDLFVAGAGDDRIVSSGADVVLAGAGNDRIVLDGGMITALQNDLGAGGNTARLAKVEGGAGLDVLELRNGLSLDFTRIDNKMMDIDNIKGRVSDIESIDLRTDTAANTLKLSVIDVLEMGNANVFNSSTGWTGLGSQVSKVQVAIDAGANDHIDLVTSQWSNTGVLAQDANGASYRVYQANDGIAAQLLIRSEAVSGG
jgi:FG-GAP repeat/RTX calcium-binding nonapeptide repeat (4 copies)